MTEKEKAAAGYLYNPNYDRVLREITKEDKMRYRAYGEMEKTTNF